MLKKILSPVLLIFLTFTIHAQKKSELISEINTLKFQLDSTKALVADAKRGERLSLARAESYEGQVKDLQNANATLLKNLNNFAEVSNKNSDNVNRTLATLQEKESQLKIIKDAISSNDSTAVVVLTNAKQTLGENAKIGVSDGAVVISADQTLLFGNDTNTNLADTATPWIQKIATILTANPNMAITIEGLSMTGELDLAGQQAISIANVLQKQFEISSDRINTLGKDGGFTEGVKLRIHPKFDQFYSLVRTHMKNGN